MFQTEFTCELFSPITSDPAKNTALVCLGSKVRVMLIKPYFCDLTGHV